MFYVLSVCCQNCSTGKVILFFIIFNSETKRLKRKTLWSISYIPKSKRFYHDHKLLNKVHCVKKQHLSLRFHVLRVLFEEQIPVLVVPKSILSHRNRLQLNVFHKMTKQQNESIVYDNQKWYFCKPICFLLNNNKKSIEIKLEKK